MSFAAIQTDTIIDYPYLWARDFESGETEGRKRRPVAVAVRLPAKSPGGNDKVLLFLITTKVPASGQLAIEIPDMEKRGGGLEADRQLWIILNE